MSDRFICVYEEKGVVKYIFFPDFILGWDWKLVHEKEFTIIMFAENVHARRA